MIVDLHFEVLESNDGLWRVHLKHHAQPISMRPEQLRSWKHFSRMVEAATGCKLLPMTDEDWLKLLDTAIVRPGKIYMHGPALKVRIDD